MPSPSPSSEDTQPSSTQQQPEHTSAAAPPKEDEPTSSGETTPVDSAPISIPTRDPSTPLPPSNSPPPVDPAPITHAAVPPPIDTHVPDASPAPSVPSSVHSPPTILTETPSLSARPSYNDAQLGPSADQTETEPAQAAAPSTTSVSPPVATPAPAAPKPQLQEAPSAVKVGGMSASDAKESITRGGGSLKDRMAAFQQKAAAPAPPPPVPRGKPGNWAWKNKAAEGASPASTAAGDAPAASSSPSAAAPISREMPVSTPSPTRPAAGAMSASDAKESITKSGGSLKERMAALQGAGAFGAPASASPPPVPSGKPKVWKRPEPVAAPQPEVVEEKKKSKWTVEEHKSDDEDAGAVEKTGKALVPDETADEAAGAGETAEEPAVEENDEEAAERARR